MNKNEYLLYSQLEKQHWWFRARRKILKEILLEIDNKHNKSVLDVGCGVGINFNMLFGSFNRVDGIDNNPEAIRFSRKINSNRMELMDACSLSKINNKYDLVSFLDVLYHKSIEDYTSVLKNAKKILNQDGYILIADGAFSFLSGGHSEHVHGSRRFTRKQLILNLESLGYEIIISKYWGVLLFFLIFIKRRMLENIFPSNSKSSDVKHTPYLVNFIMYHLVSWERIFFKYFDFPVGSSILILAKKNKGK